MKKEPAKTVQIIFLAVTVTVLAVLLYRTDAQIRAARSDTLELSRSTVEAINTELFGIDAHDDFATAQLIARAQGSAETAERMLDRSVDLTEGEAVLHEFFTVIRLRAPIILMTDTDMRQKWFAQTAHYLSTGDLESLQSVIDGINALAE